MSDYPMLISNKLHSFRNFMGQIYLKYLKFTHLRLFFIFLSAKYIESFARYFPKVNS